MYPDVNTEGLYSRPKWYTLQWFSAEYNCCVRIHQVSRTYRYLVCTVYHIITLGDKVRLRLRLIAHTR